jgi:hypothetical protein
MDAHFSISKMIWFQFLTVDFLNLYPCSTDIKKKLAGDCEGAGDKSQPCVTD